MAHISRLSLVRHLRATPNQFILHYRKGKLVRSGSGLSYWFNPLSAAVAQVPVEDVETTFMLRERSLDFQEVKVQVTLTYRVVDPVKAALRMNFTLSLESGAWVEQPLERLATAWAHWALQPARAVLNALPLVGAVRAGIVATRDAVEEALRTNPEVEAMGLALVSVQIDQVSPTPELEKALQTPTREAIQQKADEASFQRRALAVEKERAIKENELATQIELSRRQEELIRQEGANQMRDVQQHCERTRLGVEAEVEQKTLTAEGDAKQMKIRAEGEAAARRLTLDVESEAERRHVELWKDVPAGTILGLGLQGFAGKVDSIQNLNVGPDLLGDALARLLKDKPGP